MITILTAGAILLACVAIGVSVLGFVDWLRGPKPEHGRSWYVPPRHFNCRCTTMPWMRSAMKVIANKMSKDVHKNMRNFLVQAQHPPVYLGVDWGFEEQKIMGIEEGQKMGKEERKPKPELVNRYVHLQSNFIRNEVQRFLFKHGYGWNMNNRKTVREFSTPICIFLNEDFRLTWGGLRYAKESDHLEISVQELTNTLNKSVAVNKGKEQKMKKGLENVFVHTPNDLICAGVQKMILDTGITWCTGCATVDRDLAFGPCGYKENQCLSINENGGMEHCSKSHYDRLGREEVSISELADILAKPEHTLMTEEELITRLAENPDLEGALELSIEKWVRLLKEENWNALYGVQGSVYVGGSTCALCRHFHPEGELKSCKTCPLGGQYDCNDPIHAWQMATKALKQGDRKAFVFHGNDMLQRMRDALEELRRPKRTYKLGQWFRFVSSGSEFDKGLYVLARVRADEIALIGDDGDRWTDPVSVKDSRKISAEEFEKTRGSQGAKAFVPITVHTAVMGESKK